MEIVLATTNKGKVAEIGELLSGLGIEILSLDGFKGIALDAEDGASFEENALIKARGIVRDTGKAALADDSGLVVDSLGGRPGIYSARYAGDNATDGDNIEKLLCELDGVPQEKRTARFVCVVAFVLPDGKEQIFEGSLEGVLTSSPRGEGGFGYDPVFYLPEEGKTTAELTRAEKNAISHRGIALRRFKDWLAENL